MQINRLVAFLALLVVGFGVPTQSEAKVNRTILTNIGLHYCWKIEVLTYEESGYITLKFAESFWPSLGNLRKRDCPKNILYDVYTIPKGLIRGSKGVVVPKVNVGGDN